MSSRVTGQAAEMSCQEVALNYMGHGLALYDAAGRLSFANHRLSEMFSVPSARLRLGMSAVEVMETLGFSESRALEVSTRMKARLLRQRRTRALQKTTAGRIISITTQQVPGGGCITTFDDSSHNPPLEWDPERLIQRDPLTGLPSRPAFREQLDEAVTRMKRGTPFALLLLDIRDFRSTNELLGEAAGDELLKSIAQTIRGNIRAVDFPARLDGDEFAILQCNPEDPRDTEALALRLMSLFKTPYEVGDQSVIANVNIGIVMGISDGADSCELMKNAYLALCRAKQSLLPCYSFFNAAIDSDLKTQRALEHDLYEAARTGGLSLYYQRIVDTQTGQTLGVEALLRWRHPIHGWIPPAQFVPIAEECGLIVSIGAWVLNTACQQAAAWPSHWRIAVNLSPMQFQEGLLPAMVKQAFEMANLAPHRLELEITESVLLKDNDVNLGILAHLRELGVRICLDDFGTGYSSLSYLRNFRFDKLKIDKSFIQDLPHDNTAKTIVKAVTELGRDFGMSIVAEGVESAKQLEYLRQLRCDEVQGYFVGMPLPPEELLSEEASATGTRALQDELAPVHAI